MEHYTSDTYTNCGEVEEFGCTCPEAWDVCCGLFWNFPGLWHVDCDLLKNFCMCAEELIGIIIEYEEMCNGNKRIAN